MLNSKKELRGHYNLLVSQKFAQGFLVQNQQQLNDHLRKYASMQKGLWGAYRALSNEASVDEVLKTSGAVEWAFPRIVHEHLLFCRGSQFVRGPFGIQEPPQTSQQVDLKDIQGLLIPGLSFNKDGSRLGKGKGFYDKALAQYQGIKVGVCFDFQISEKKIPTEQHDVRMDFLLTESGLVDCQSYQE
jgi:5-formyltetrahydrofolate cyclo-ligase